MCSSDSAQAISCNSQSPARDPLAVHIRPREAVVHVRGLRVHLHVQCENLHGIVHPLGLQEHVAEAVEFRLAIVVGVGLLRLQLAVLLDGSVDTVLLDGRGKCARDRGEVRQFLDLRERGVQVRARQQSPGDDNRLNPFGIGDVVERVRVQQDQVCLFSDINRTGGFRRTEVDGRVDGRGSQRVERRQSCSHQQRQLVVQAEARETRKGLSCRSRRAI